MIIYNNNKYGKSKICNMFWIDTSCTSDQVLRFVSMYSVSIIDFRYLFTPTLDACNLRCL